MSAPTRRPTKEETDQLIAQYEADGDFYKSLGEHNREVARERIAAFRANVDDIIETRINGDRYAFVRSRGQSGCDCPACRSRPSIVKPILIGVLILLGAFAVAWIFS